MCEGAGPLTAVTGLQPSRPQVHFDNLSLQDHASSENGIVRASSGSEGKARHPQGNLQRLAAGNTDNMPDELLLQAQETN